MAIAEPSDFSLLGQRVGASSGSSDVEDEEAVNGQVFEGAIEGRLPLGVVEQRPRLKLGARRCGTGGFTLYRVIDFRSLTADTE